MVTDDNPNPRWFDMVRGIECAAPDSGEAPATEPVRAMSAPEEDLAEALFDAMVDSDATERAAAKPLRNDALSGLQQRLWLVQQMDPESTAYIIPCHLRIRGRANRAVLKQALQAIWMRHEALRTVFPCIDGHPRRVLLPADGFVIHEYDFGVAEAKQGWERHYLDHHSAAIRLDEGPLFRVCIYALAADELVLLIDLHHINGDGVSLEIIRGELFEVYAALLEGRRSALPPSGAEYSAYVAHEAARRESGEYQRQLHARSEALSGAPTRIAFLFDKPVPDRFAYRGAVVARNCDDPSPYARAIERGRDAGLSPFMVFLAAFGSMLYFHTRQEDLLIGIPISLREGEGFARTVGFFVNTGVVRLDFSGNPTLREVMQRTGRAVRDMLRCPEVPLDQLVRILRSNRTPDRPPLIQASLSYMASDSLAAPAAPGLSIESLYVLRRSAMFEVTMDVLLRKDGAMFGLEYSSDVWDEGSIERMFEHFYILLQALAERPDLRIGEVNLMPAKARETLAAVLEGELLEPAAQCIPDWIAQHARCQPGRTAIIFDGTETTFGRLDALVSRCRGQLGALGLKNGAVLALACGPGLEWTVTTLAAMAEGIVVLPLDKEMPAARLRTILDDCGAELLWHDDDFSPVAAGLDLAFPLVSCRTAPEAESVRGPSKVLLSATAYLIYTSGTTGRPKGVRVSHGAFEAQCRSAVRAYGLNEQDRALVFAPMHFDASWEQLFAPLQVGAAVLIRDTHLWAPDELCLRISESRVTCADVPPHYLRELLFYWKTRPDSVPACLRLVVSGGEAMPSSLAQAWLEGPLQGVPLINAYGPTEAVVTSTFNRICEGSRILTANGVVPIGKPMPGRLLRILDADGMEVGAGIAGELCLGGPCLADGYHGDAMLTDEVFRYWLRTNEGGRWTHEATPGAIRLYRTGDRVRVGPDHCVEFLGRIDRQIKLRGFRIEPGEIEAVLASHPSIAQAVVTAFDDPVAGRKLVAYCVPSGPETASRRDLAAWLARRLPEHMIPADTVFVPEFPVTANGKTDASALPKPATRCETDRELAPPIDELAARIVAIWADVLHRSDVGLDDNFFDLGGHSILLVRVHTRLQSELGAELPLVDLFANPTVARMAKRLRGETPTPSTRRKRARHGDVAVIGMSGRFPGAANVDELWANLTAGRESIRFFAQEELREEGVPEGLRARPDYVPAHGYLEGTKLFDAGFFGYTPKEAEIIDPQQRLFLEEAWHALENAGYDPGRFVGDIAVFGGMGMSIYLLSNLGSLLRQGYSADAYAISLANDKDFITTRVSYKLDLRGPSVNVNTACSTSLVAIHMAAEALLRDECDIALAGGATLHLPPRSGYVYQSGGIASPDGHCRAFAETASGTVGGSGVAIVVLKRLDPALADGDTIHAVIKGSAINNDGADKVGFTAPGVTRQRDVIRAALDDAGLSARSVRYVEAHGTGTPMGDPIEIRALTEAFAADQPDRRSCYVGSIKSNIGHLDTAAGVAGFIKATLAVEHGLIPPTLHCEHPSSTIDFEHTPFRVAQKLTPWPKAERRRAAVSSFGMGGTNAHVVLEQPPTVHEPARPRQDVWCIPISARSTKSLRAFAQNLARYIEERPELDAVDLWFTLSEGRRRFPMRAVVLADSRVKATAALQALRETDILCAGGHDGLVSGIGNPQAALFAERSEFNGVRAFAKAWLTAEQAAASALLPQGPLRRIPLPTYVFDHELFWVKPRLDEANGSALPPDTPAKSSIEDWFYFPSWERVPARRGAAVSNARILLVHNGSTAEERWMEAMRTAGMSFAPCLGGSELENSLAGLARGEELPALCWHLGALGQLGGPADYARGLAALLADIRTLAAAQPSRAMTLVMLAPHTGPPDAPLEPAFAYLDAACAVLPHEYGGLSPLVLRVAPTAIDEASLLAARSASSRPEGASVLTLCGGTLWRRTFNKLPADHPGSGAARLVEGGVYLITGGLGGLGLTLAKHLAHTCRARLLLISRSHPDAGQQEALRAMEADGAQVRTAALDIADAGALRVLVDDVAARWGRIDGVIHAAGVAGGSLVARTRLDEIERVLRAKVAGTEALADALRGREPSFVTLCSSLTASLGGPGQAAYAAANAWMDAFAAAQAARQPGRWTSVQWDRWAEVGMAARADAAAKPISAERKLLREWSITPDSYWPWGEHRVGDAPMLPGTAYLDMFVQALNAAGPIELEAIALSEPMTHAGEASRQVQVLREGDELILQSDDGTCVREHARARVCAVTLAPAPVPVADIEARCSASAPAERPDAGQGIVIETSPRWAIEGTYLKGDDEALARLELPARFVSDLAQHPLHPALLDVAISHYVAYIEGGRNVLPWRFEKLRVFAPLAARIVSHVRLRSHDERVLVLDADLRDASGRLLVQVEGYTLVAGTKHATSPTRRAKEANAHPFAMTPMEGVEAFVRSLAAAEPVICISTVAWRHAERAATLPGAVGEHGREASEDESARKPRPATAVPFRAARTEVEELMVGVWTEVLGYESIGVDDDLFDLGADSLSALQASARVKELTGRELSMARFFAQATIANLSQDIPAPSRDGAKGQAPGGTLWEEGEL